MGRNEVGGVTLRRRLSPLEAANAVRAIAEELLGELLHVLAAGVVVVGPEDNAQSAQRPERIAARHRARARDGADRGDRDGAQSIAGLLPFCDDHSRAALESRQYLRPVEREVP